MARKCSYCGKNGHNSRTCINSTSLVDGGGLKLFGVQLHISCSPMKKSFSTAMDYLSSSSFFASSSASPSSSPSNSFISIDETTENVSNGYLSDDLFGRSQERKKGAPWNIEEHKNFLLGLEKLGKGDWRGISRNFVTTRTPTQVASHAQKYFLRQNSFNKKQRRSSLFDLVGNCERSARAIDETSRLKFPILSLSKTSNQDSSTVIVDGNLTEEVAQLPDLELTISSSRSLEGNKSSCRSLLIGNVRVT